MKESRLHTVNEGPITGLGESRWIPPHTAKNYPELKTVLDILKRPDLFPHKADMSKGAFVCVAWPSGDRILGGAVVPVSHVRNLS